MPRYSIDRYNDRVGVQIGTEEATERAELLEALDEVDKEQARDREDAWLLRKRLENGGSIADYAMEDIKTRISRLE